MLEWVRQSLEKDLVCSSIFSLYATLGRGDRIGGVHGRSRHWLPRDCRRSILFWNLLLCNESIQWIRGIELVIKVMVIGRTFILCLAALIFIVPLTLLKNFDSLRFTSIVAFLFILYITVVVCYYLY